MKTIKNAKEVKRVSDEIAQKLTKKGWKYCPKSEFKALFKEKEEKKEEKKKGK